MRASGLAECLGEFQVFVIDQEITQAHWVSTKARDMLAYFVTERHKHVPLEKATVDIWPEQGHQGRAFHSALYRLRQAMRQGDEKTKFVIVKGGECWLDTALCTIDADEFETAINEAIRAAQPAGPHSPDQPERWRQDLVCGHRLIPWRGPVAEAQFAAHL